MSRRDWQAFLRERGATISEDGTASFGDDPAQARLALHGDIVVDLSDQALIAVGGADAIRFLHGQLTSDLHALPRDRSQLSAWCSPKGRVLAMFRVFHHDPGFLLQLPHELLEPTLKRLRLYVLRAAVELNDASDALLPIGVAGPAATAALVERLGDVPPGVDDVRRSQGLTVTRLPGARPRFQVLGPAAAMRSLWEHLAGAARPGGRAAWALLDILAAVPTVGRATADAFLPQMLNLQALGALSFTKGCYPGQEIIARTHHLGTLKRRLYLVHAEAETPPRPGDPVHTAAAEGAVGTVLAAEAHPDGGVVLLAVLQIGSAEGHELHLGSRAAGPALRLEPLPYAL